MRVLISHINQDDRKSDGSFSQAARGAIAGYGYESVLRHQIQMPYPLLARVAVAFMVAKKPRKDPKASLALDGYSIVKLWSSTGTTPV